MIWIILAALLGAIAPVVAEKAGQVSSCPAPSPSPSKTPEG